MLPRLRSNPLDSKRKDDSDELDETVVHGPGSILESRVVHTSLEAWTTPGSTITGSLRAQD